ncbi:MAG: entericidin A/B family lipoprotein [Candidatus Methylomirabilales bacterium]
MRPQYIRGVVGLLLGVLLLWTAGCATMRGMGEDIQSLGRGIKKVFSE